MIAVVPTPAGLREATDSGGYVKAILNILEDAAEKRLDLEAAQRAVLDIMAGFREEKDRLGDIQKAMLNILEDSGSEKTRLEAAQKAILNILEDFDVEKNKVEQINREMAGEIAEREKAEEGLQQAKAAADAANRELEAFSYSVAHDLRAPLRAIDGFSQVLLEDYAGQLDAAGQASLERIRAGSQHLARLIDDLLELSRVTRSEIHRARVDLSALARKIAAELRTTAPDRLAEFVIADELVAEGDARLLQIVLENLLGNAWKFTAKRERARVEFDALPQAEGDVPAYFVRDNGAGFDMAYADKLFGAFQRLHSVEEFPGTGIGLATVQRIVHRHGGRVRGEGQLGSGATFYFTLPPPEAADGHGQAYFPAPGRKPPARGNP